MRGVRTTAVIMTGVIFVEAWPLALIGLEPGGPAKLAKYLGYGAPAINPWAWGLGLVVALTYAAVSTRSLPFIRRHVLDVSPLKLLAIAFALVTGTFEEVFFRKWIMDGLVHLGWPLAAQIAVSGVAFGIAHAMWGLLGRNRTAALRAMIFTTTLGLALAAVYSLAGRQLAPAVWSHILINLIIEPWLMLGVMSLRWQEPRAATG